MKKYLSRFIVITLGLVALLAHAGISSSTMQVSSELAYPVMLKEDPKSNYLKVSLTGKDLLRETHRSPINISLVIDRSGSMRGEKIEKARDAALLAVDMLRRGDMISVIGYDYSAEVIVAATKIVNKQQIKSRIREAIRADGNTALFAGVAKGIKEVDKYLSKNNVNRVILLSDGQANVGPSSSSELGELGVAAAKKGIAVTTIGLGEGYNEDLMTTLAGYSDGNHFFVENAGDLETAFNSEFNDVMNVVAQNVKVNIDVKHGRAKRLLGRDGRISGNHVTVKLNQVYANQEKYVLLEIAAPTHGHKGEKQVANIDISYDVRGKRKHIKQSVSLLYTDSTALFEKAINEEILADVFIQQSNLANARAIKALDRGDKKAAEMILSEAESYISTQADQLSSQAARDKVESKARNFEQSIEKIQMAPVINARKAIKAESYRTLKQQK